MKTFIKNNKVLLVIALIQLLITAGLVYFLILQQKTLSKINTTVTYWVTPNAQGIPGFTIDTYQSLNIIQQAEKAQQASTTTQTQ